MKPVLSIFRNIKITIAAVSPKKCVGLLCLVLLISPYGMGTTILVVLQGDNVWIAADSLQSGNNGEWRYTCKVYREEAFYWAAAGQIFEDVTTGYSVQKMVAEVASTKGDLVDVMNALIAKAKVDAATEFASLRKDTPREFAKLVQPDHTVLVAKVALIGNGNGHPPEVVFATIKVDDVGTMVVSGSPDQASAPFWRF